MKQLVSLDGGVTYQPATDGVRIIYQEVDVPGEDEDGELHVNCTHEGLILDVWMNNEESTNIGTNSETVDEIVSRLVEANA
jgi:hypothetical protein